MATIDDTQANNRLSERLRSGLALAQTRIHTMESRAKNQWTDLPVQLRAMLDRAVERLRTTLDLPSRSDVSDLVDRLEALDRKMVALEKRQGKRAAGPETASRADITVEARDQEATEVEKPSAVEAAAIAEPTPAQRAAGAKAGAKADDETGAKAHDKTGAKADDKTTTRKNVKPTSAAKTVTASKASKAASKTAGASTTRGSTSGQSQARGRKKNNRR